MSSQPKQIFPGLYDSKYVDLVRKITEKTRAKKITWSRTPNGMNTSVSGKMHLGFVRSSGVLVTPEKWALFTIRDEDGNEILNINNSSPFSIASAVLGGGPPPVSSALRKAVEELFEAIEEIARVEVEKLIDVVDRI
jgi:hypothetical protein